MRWRPLAVQWTGGGIHYRKIKLCRLIVWRSCEQGAVRVAELLAFPVKSDTSDEMDISDPSDFVIVEVTDLPAGISRASRPGDIAAKATKSLDAALDIIRPVATALVTKVNMLDEPPHEVSVEFGVKLTAKTGAVLVESQAEGHIKVSISWNSFSSAPHSET
jgi:hypothetical protein